MTQQQIPSPQFSAQQYHDLVTFQAYQLMQAEMALSRREQELQMLAARVVELDGKLKAATAQPTEAAP